jgi:hypothetical protein
VDAAEHRRALLTAFGITEADLQANRAGRLGPRQATSIRRSGARNLAAALAGGAILAAILAFVVDRPLVPAQYITAGLLFVAMLAVGVYDVVRTRRAAAAGVVEEVRGPVGVQSRGRQGWFLMVGQEEFRVPVQPWKLFPGASYRVYFARQARRVVAMEPDESMAAARPAASERHQ